ncbi:hypothetical protein X743_14985 [Mesorhizobium sp. LNHC252B00]|nr:hypothetical protein X743_14985 [Mesorhizobium sp. LNHC252B00]
MASLFYRKNGNAEDRGQVVGIEYRRQFIVGGEALI